MEYGVMHIPFECQSRSIGRRVAHYVPVIKRRRPFIQKRRVYPVAGE